MNMSRGDPVLASEGARHLIRAQCCSTVLQHLRGGTQRDTGMQRDARACQAQGGTVTHTDDVTLEIQDYADYEDCVVSKIVILRKS